MTSILGPEGYCGRCAFIVPLDSNGMLCFHSRGRHTDSYSPAPPCPGTGRPAWKKTPYYSVKAAFRVTGGKADCPECGRRVRIRVSVVSGTRFRVHWPLWFSTVGVKECPGSNQLVK